MKGRILDYHEEDEWVINKKWIENHDWFFADTFAEELAQDHYHDDPCDPDAFDCKVLVDINGEQKTFRITAEADVNFSSDEIKA